MAHLKRKTILAILFSLGFGFIFAFCLYAVDSRQLYFNYENIIQRRSTNVADLYESLVNDASMAEDSIHEDFTAVTQMMAIGLSDFAADGVFTGPDVFENGFVAELRNGRLIFPQEVQNRYSAYDTSALLKEMTPVEAIDQEEDTVLLTSCRIDEKYYYVGWLREDDTKKYIQNLFDINGRLEDVCRNYGGGLFVFDLDYPEAGITSSAGDLSGSMSLEDLGLNAEMLEVYGENPFPFSVGEHDYIARAVSIQALGRCVVYCEEVSETLMTIVTRNLSVYLFAGVFFVTLLVWLISTQRMVRDSILTDVQKSRYAPRNIKARTGMLILVCSALIFLIGFVSMMLLAMSRLNQSGESILGMVEAQADAEQARMESIAQEDTDWVECYGIPLSELIELNPSLRTKERLSEIAEAISADYIMLFDEEGNETVSSSDFINLSLGTSEDDPSTDFRRILLGVKSIVHESDLDTITGMSHQKIGIRYRISEVPDRFGVIIIAISPTSVRRYALDNVTRQLFTALASPTYRVLRIDPETHIILNAGDAQLTSQDITQLGVAEDALHDRYMNFFMLNNTRYYGIMRRIGDFLYCYATRSADMMDYPLTYGMYASGAFTIGFILLAVILLFGYNRKNFEQYAAIGRNVSRKGNVQIKLADGRNKLTLDPSERWSGVFMHWSSLFPEQKARIVFDILLAGSILTLFLGKSGDVLSGAASGLSLVFLNGWTKGLNFFAMTAVVMIVCIATLVRLALRLVFRIIYSFTNSKGETICRLLSSLLQYIVVIVMLYYCLEAIGVDTTTLLTSIGILSLAVSFGSQDLVKDILAGINIVFEGEYEVGDIVEINSYRGTVQEIGVRSTKLIGDGNNIKIINNRDVKNVLNMTRLNSWYEVALKVPATVSLDVLEETLNRELPKIGKKIPEIISGPVYKGVISISGSTMTIDIFAEYQEKDYYKVQRKLNRALKKLFASENIAML